MNHIEIKNIKKIVKIYGNRIVVSVKQLVFFLISISALTILTLSNGEGRVYAGINNTINFQSKIVSKTSGLNVSAGSPSCVKVTLGTDTCNFRVRVWNVSSGGVVTTGNNLMFEELFTSVQLGNNNGIFNLSINSVCLATPSADSLTSWSITSSSATVCNLVKDSINNSTGVNFNRSDLWIEIAFDPSGSDTTLSTFNADGTVETFTRTNLRSVPSAFAAQTLSGGFTSSNFVQLAPSSPQLLASSNTLSLINLSTPQTSSTNPLVLINKTGSSTSDFLNLQSSGVNKFQVASTGFTTIGGGSNTGVLTVNQTGTSATNYGVYSNTTGAGTTNVAGYFSATNALTNNYGLVVANGFTGLGTTTPTQTLDVVGNVQNISNASALPTLKGSVSTGASSAPWSVYVQGKNAYVVNHSSNNLNIFDISNPAAPISVGTISTSTGPSSVYVSGKYAYVVCSSSNFLNIFEISNPVSPVSVATITTGASTTPLSIFISGRYAYISNNGNNTMSIFDISIPASPILQGSVSTGTGPYSVYLQGRYAYTANLSASTISVIDVSIVAFPSVVGSVSTGASTGPSSIYIEGRYAYTANYTNGSISVLDVSNPTSPSLTGSVSTGSGSNTVSALYVSGRYLYTAYGSVVDVSNPSSPVLIGTGSGGSTSTGPYSMYVLGKYSYIPSTAANTLLISDLKGTETTSIIAHSADIGNLSVRNDLAVNGQLLVQGGISVGAGGINSTGSISTTANSYLGSLSVGQNTVSTDFIDVAANTTTQASIRLAASAGVNVTAPVSGDAWWNGTNLYFYNGTSNTDLLKNAVSNFVNFASGSAQTTASAVSLINIQQNTSTTNTLAIINNNGGGVANLLDLQTAGTSQLKVDSSGNLTTIGNILTSTTVSTSVTSKYLYHSTSNTGTLNAFRNATDNLGNNFVVGTFTGTADFGTGTITALGAQDFYLEKISPNGSALWVVHLTAATSSPTVVPQGVALDPAGNIYMTGYWGATPGTSTINFGTGSITQTAGASNYDFFVVKFNISGIAQWTVHANSNSNYTIIRSIGVDSSGNSYITGQWSGVADFGTGSVTANSASGNDFFLVKYNTSGTAQWTSHSSANTGTVNSFSIAVDLSGNSYIAGNWSGTANFGTGSIVSNPGTGGDFFLVKFNTSGTAQWTSHSSANSGSISINLNNLAVDSSGNTYFYGSWNGTINFGTGSIVSNPGTGNDFFLVKFNTSGTAQWVTHTSSNSGNINAFGLTLDFSNNIYLSGGFTATANFGTGFITSNPGTNQDYFIAKFNTSGTAIWVNHSVSNTGTITAYYISTDGYGNVYIGSNWSGTANFGTGSIVSNSASGNDIYVAKYSQAYTGSNIGSTSNPFANTYSYTYNGKVVNISSFDLAEQYNVTDSSIEPGDIVKFLKSSSSDSLLVEKAGGINNTYDKSTIGVISTAPGLYLQDWSNNSTNTRPVALAGRVPVKISLENGDIHRGDYLTSSSIKGYAMKATSGGLIIGRAMEDFTSSNIGSDINISGGDSPLVKAKLTQDKSTGDTIVSQLKTDGSLSSTDATQASTIIDNITKTKQSNPLVSLTIPAVAGIVSNTKINTASVTAETTKTIKTGRIMMFVNLTYIDNASYVTSNNSISDSIKIIDSPTSLPTSYSSTDTLSNSINDLNTLASSLNARFNTLNQQYSQLVNLNNLFDISTVSSNFKKIVISNDGSLSFQNVLSNSYQSYSDSDLILKINSLSNVFKIVDSNNLTLFSIDQNGKISVRENQNGSTGSAIIIKDSTSVFVPNTSLLDSSKVIVTRYGFTKYDVVKNLDKTKPVGFTIELGAPQDTDIKFDYLIVN